jgi:3-isopropylmalate dehydrogenase
MSTSTNNSKKVAKIVVLPGDGIGPEVTKQARRVLEVVAQNNDQWEFTFEEHAFGGSAIDQAGKFICLLMPFIV